MGRTAHNPEVHEELDHIAAVRWLSIYGEGNEDVFEILVGQIQFEFPKVMQAIMDAGAYKLVDETELIT